MKCRSAYLGWRELPADVGQLSLEGKKGKVTRRSKIANRARRRAISSKYQLLEHRI